jgi:lipid-binding SYLF domain-containing protein
MKLDRRTVLSGTAAAFAAPFLGSQPARADAKRQSLVDSCLATARKILGGPDFPDAAGQMVNARGVLIIPELVQGGFIFGAAGGRGVLLGRSSPNNWSYPAFYGMGSGSVGLQVGGKVSEIVFIIRTEKGLQAILDHKFKVGAEAGVTMVAVGIGLEGATTGAGGADIVARSAAGCIRPAASGAVLGDMLHGDDTRFTPATRSMAPPMPFTILPGIIQLARSPFSATSMAPRIDRSIWPPRIIAKLSAELK